MSNWTNSHFLLPDINATIERDGTVRLSLNQETFSDIGLEFIEDKRITAVYSKSSANFGGDNYLPLTYSDPVMITQLFIRE